MHLCSRPLLGFSPILTRSTESLPDLSGDCLNVTAGAPAGFTAINGGAAATWEPRTIRTASPRSRTSQLKHAAEFPEGHPASAHSLHGTTPYQRLQLHNRALQQAKQESYRMLNNVKADRHPQRSSWPINQDRSPPHQQRCISLQQQAGLRDQLASKAHSITPCQASCENYNSPFSAQVSQSCTPSSVTLLL